ncbi:hypothetical protein [Hyalangium gracile]|uniref:hypothetical protein n=1 Tax=Hyalangium gracile TaxID=394092 RepID=UPI001CC9F26C|nr:hypothetical protein [Hyalangium gracile]
MVTAALRGQATVELALGLLVFVTVLVFGLHFAETGYVMLEVTEANASALWHASSAKMHRLPGDFSPLEQLIAQDSPGRETTARYQDFDGRTSKQGEAQARLVFTQASGLRVTCDAGPQRMEHRPHFKPVKRTGEVFKDVGTMRCRAQATVRVLDAFPQSFLDSGPGALFQERHLNPLTMTVCGVNRAQGTSCERGFSLLLDDWGLATDDELNECEVLEGRECRNPAYFQSVRLVYKQHLPPMGAARMLAERTVGGTPGNFDPSTFYMSFRVFQERGPGGDKDPNNWMTTPGKGSPTPEYDSAYGLRGTCFLGQKC